MMMTILLVSVLFFIFIFYFFFNLVLDSIASSWLDSLTILEPGLFVCPALSIIIIRLH